MSKQVSSSSNNQNGLTHLEELLRKKKEDQKSHLQKLIEAKNELEKSRSMSSLTNSQIGQSLITSSNRSKLQKNQVQKPIDMQHNMAVGIAPPSQVEIHSRVQSMAQTSYR